MTVPLKLGTTDQLAQQINAARLLATLNQTQLTESTRRSLPARFWSRVRYVAALAFTARQKQFNLEVVAALDTLQSLVGELRAELADLRTDLEPPHVRPGTLDDAIWTDVNRRNEYSLPEQFESRDVILDIGAHIGSFSFACLRRGAGAVVAYEPDPDNATLASLNLARFGGRGEVKRVAVWRSDGQADPLRLLKSDDPSNTGGGGVASSTVGPAVETVAFDMAVQSALTQFDVPRLRLVKLDCEGSEYAILMTSRSLDRIASLCGEYHEFPRPKSDHGRDLGTDGFDRNTLRRILEGHGFRVELRQHTPNPNVGLFFANRDAA